jgi:hypothetical protein
MSQSDFVDPDAVRASIGEFVDQIGHEPLTATMSHATWTIVRHGEQFHVECFGSGGGWYAHREMGRRQLVAYLKSQDELRLRRPESQRGEA